jgi:hypothetical protein
MLHNFGVLGWWVNVWVYIRVYRKDVVLRGSGVHDNPPKLAITICDHVMLCNITHYVP